MEMKTGIRRSNDELERFKQDKIESKFLLKDQPNFRGSSELLKAMQQYERSYREGKPMISDEEWDKLVTETGYEESLDDIISAGGRTWSKMNAPLPSLQKINSIDSLRNFISQFPENSKFIVSGKLDGLTFDAFYRRSDNNDFELFKVGTRGDGLNSLILYPDALIGVDTPGLPRTIPANVINELEKKGCVINDIVELRGEAVCSIPFYVEEGYSKSNTVWRSIAAGIFNRQMPLNEGYLIRRLSEECSYKLSDSISDAKLDQIWASISAEGKAMLAKIGLIGRKSPYKCVVSAGNETSPAEIYVKLKSNGNKWMPLSDCDYRGLLTNERLDFISYSIASKIGNIDRKEIINLIPGAIYVNDVADFKEFSAITSNVDDIIKCIDNFYGTTFGKRDFSKPRLKNIIGYPCDGIVIKLYDSSNETQKMQPVFKHGKYVVPHHPQDQAAIKLPTDPVKTRIIKINYKVTKLGNTTVSADIEPVVAEGGAVVKCVNLHNPNWLSLPENAWIKEGADCNLQLSMDIIPILSPIE